MVVRSWMTSLDANSGELKLASGLALASVIIVFIIVLWSVFLSAETTNESPDFKGNFTVQTIDPPTFKDAKVTPPNKKDTHLSQTNTPKKATLKKTHLPKQKVAQQQSPKSNIVLGQGNYYLQVGAFKQAKLARLMLEKMKRKYQYAKIKKKADKHAVWVGPVVSKANALQLQKYVQRKDNIKGFITVEK
jgi:cell division septation protein DedD